MSRNVITPQGLEPLQFPTKFRSHSRELLEVLASSRVEVTTSELTDQTRLAETTVRRTLEDLKLVGLVERRSTALGEQWQLATEQREVAVALLKGSPSTPAPGPHPPRSPASQGKGHLRPLNGTKLQALRALPESSGQLAGWRERAGLTERTSKRVAAHLVQVGYVHRVRHGLYELTDEGRRILAPADTVAPDDGDQRDA